MTHKELVDSLLLASEAAAMTGHPTWAKIMGDAAFVIEQEERYGAFWKEEAIQAKAYLTQLVPRWIPITERLPQDAGIYIICDHYGNVMSRHFCKSHGKFAGYWHFNGSAKYGNPTHWMPLPEPPKGEEHE